MMLHYRERMPTVLFTFICGACEERFKDTAPSLYCDRCDGGPHGEIGGE